MHHVILRGQFMDALGNYSSSTERLDRAQSLLYAIETLAISRGLKLPKPQAQSLDRFQSLSRRVQDRFIGNLQLYQPIFEDFLHMADEFLDVDVAGEWRCLEVAQQRYDLRFPSKLSDYIDEGDIIEIYDVDAIQVYRNLNFFRTTNYNLLDIISNPWMELWDRSRIVQGQLESMVARVMDTDAEDVSPCGVPQHILKERAFDQSQALITQPRFVTKVMCGDGQPFGFLFTVKATPIAAGAEADKIGFV
jgi:hypothetical protein